MGLNSLVGNCCNACVLFDWTRLRLVCCFGFVWSCLCVFVSKEKYLEKRRKSRNMGIF
jgi:hypothetical protein